MQRKTIVDEDEILKIMKEADIPGVAIAFVDQQGTIKTQEIGVTEQDSTDLVTTTTIFGAASLSKSLFSYLVLKWAQENKFDLEKPLFNHLSFVQFCDQFCQEYNCQWNKTTENMKRAEALNVKMILSHTTGFDVFKNKIDSRFSPGTEYRYSGLPLMYLQKVIEQLTNLNLEELAKKYVFKPLDMKHSSFYPNHDLGSMSDMTSNQEKETHKIPQANAANSLFTTAEDYMKFIKAWMRDETLQYAFEPIISMTKDEWAIGVNVPFSDLKKLACGMGFELEENGKDKLPLAYKTGDMNKWRGQVAIDLTQKTAIVYFANAKNGHILARQIITPYVKLEHALNYFSQKYGFAVEPEPDWQSNEKARFDRIGKYLDSRHDPSSHHKSVTTQAHVSSQSIFLQPQKSSDEKEKQNQKSVFQKKIR